jgi:hypothetical protein
MPARVSSEAEKRPARALAIAMPANAKMSKHTVSTATAQLFA